MKKHLSTILIMLLFSAGICVLLYPTVSNYINSRNQSQAIAAYKEHLDELDTSTYDEIMAQAQAYNERLTADPNRFVMEPEEREQYLHMLGSTGGAVGYIEIDPIQVTLPIYLGDSSAVLRVGAGTMPGASLPIGGAGTHSVITGHRGLPSAQLFTHLDQLVEGDEFVLHVLNETLTYRIDQIRIVEPQDLTELAIEPGQDYCTLVTCTPYGINTHRMLVRGHRVENGSRPAAALHVPADAILVDNMVVILGIATVLVLVFAAALCLRDRKQAKNNKMG